MVYQLESGDSLLFLPWIECCKQSRQNSEACMLHTWMCWFHVIFVSRTKATGGPCIRMILIVDTCWQQGVPWCFCWKMADWLACLGDKKFTCCSFGHLAAIDLAVYLLHRSFGRSEQVQFMKLPLNNTNPTKKAFEISPLKSKSPAECLDILLRKWSHACLQRPHIRDENLEVPWSPWSFQRRCMKMPSNPS